MFRQQIISALPDEYIATRFIKYATCGFRSGGRNAGAMVFRFNGGFSRLNFVGDGFGCFLSGFLAARSSGSGGF